MMTNMEIQRALKQLGLYQGKIDGILGRKTEEAIKHFQALNGLKIDGIVGKITEKELLEEISIIEDRNESNFVSIDIKSSKYPIETRSQKELKEFYGDPSKNEIQPRLVKATLPYQMKLAWDTSVSVNKITIHKKCKEDLEYIFETTLRFYGLSNIKDMGLDLFGGSYNQRKMRGADRWSTHAYGCAIDLDPAHNRLKWHSGTARFSGIEYNEFWNIVEMAGATSLGRVKDYDWMHIQFANRGY